jgi:hypothetical protein
MHKRKEAIDLNDNADVRHHNVHFRDVEKEVNKRVTVAKWLSVQKFKVREPFKKIFINATIGLIDIWEEVLVTVNDKQRRGKVFMFQPLQIIAAAEAVVRGATVHGPSLEEACDALAKSTTLGKHAACATEDDFLAAHAELSANSLDTWNSMMDGAFYRFEPATTFQYDVDLENRTFEQERTYPWGFMQQVLIYARVAQKAAA